MSLAPSLLNPFGPFICHLQAKAFRHLLEGTYAALVTKCQSCDLADMPFVFIVFGNFFTEYFTGGIEINITISPEDFQ